MAQQDTDNGLLLEGTGYVRNRRISNSHPVEVGNMISLTIKPNLEVKKRISRKKGTAGNALDSVTIKDATEVKFGSDTFNKLTLAMALSGQSIEMNTQAQSINDEEITVTSKGVWLQLAHHNIDGKTVQVKDQDEQEVKDEDIEINETLGWILIKTTNENVHHDTTIKVSYKTRAGGGLHVEASTEADYDFEFWLDGYNHASGKNFLLYIPSMIVSPSSEIDWLGDDFASAEFSGTLVLADGKTSPYTFEEFNNE